MMIYYSYQYDSTYLIKAIVRSTKQITGSNCVNRTKRYAILRYGYDASSNIAYIPVKDANGITVLTDGKVTKEENKDSEQISLV